LEVERIAAHATGVGKQTFCDAPFVLAPTPAMFWISMASFCAALAVNDEHQTTNLGVRSSNLFGRNKDANTYIIVIAN
jgi:hypothetical protein